MKSRIAVNEWNSVVGAAGDDAAIENLSNLLRKNVLDRQAGVTGDELRIAIVT